MARPNKWKLFLKTKKEELSELKANRTRIVEKEEARIEALNKVIEEIENFDLQGEK